MQDLYKEGKVRAIGVSNFQPDRLIDLIVHNEIVPAVNQIETHPFHQQIETQKFLQENNVQIESWGPFAEGKNNIFQNELLGFDWQEIQQNHCTGDSSLAYTKRCCCHSKISSQRKNGRELQQPRF